MAAPSPTTSTAARSQASSGRLHPAPPAPAGRPVPQPYQCLYQPGLQLQPREKECPHALHRPEPRPEPSIYSLRDTKVEHTQGHLLPFPEARGAMQALFRPGLPVPVCETRLVEVGPGVCAGRAILALPDLCGAIHTRDASSAESRPGSCLETLSHPGSGPPPLGEPYTQTVKLPQGLS